MQSRWFFTNAIKILLGNFWAGLEACHVTITGGVVYKKSMIFEVFWEYLSEFLMFFHEILMLVSFGKYISPL